MNRTQPTRDIATISGLLCLCVPPLLIARIPEYGANPAAWVAIMAGAFVGTLLLMDAKYSGR